jgi:hypothetical protein
MANNLDPNSVVGSASALYQSLTDIRNTGQSVLDAIQQSQTSVLLDLQQSLEVLNARQQRASHLLNSDIVCRFLVSDFETIDQSQTSATVRIDSESASLRERAQPAEIVIRKQTFTTTTGTSQQFGGYSQVNVPDGTIPTGSFNLELTDSIALTMVVFDIVSLAGAPGIEVLVSQDGVVYNAASQVSLDGYRVNAWFQTQSVKFVRIQITPAHPDNLGGTTFTFGLTDFNASAVEFHLLSDLITRPVKTMPSSSRLVFTADTTPGIQYFYSFDGTTFLNILPGQEVAVPGATDAVVNSVTINSDGSLNHTVPSGLYYSTVQISDVDGTPYRFAPEVNPALTPTNSYITYWNNKFYLLPYDNATQSSLHFNVKYTTGPSSVQLILHVRISTSDSSLTPVFRGASFQNANA